MKKLMAVLLAAFMLAGVFSGCKKRAEEPVSSEPQSVSEPQVSGPMTAEQAAANNAKINSGDVRLIQFTDLDDGDPVAVIETSEGEIKIRLFPDQTPETAAAFEKLMESGYYNGQTFGMVVPGYKVECAGIAGKDGGFPETPEFSLELWNFRGAVALSNNGADFMVIQAGRSLNPKDELEKLNFPKSVVDKYIDEGGAPHQDWKNPVFGMVVEGMGIVDKIAAAKIGEDGKPEAPVVITGTSMEYHAEGSADPDAPEENGEESEEESAAA